MRSDAPHTPTDRERRRLLDAIERIEQRWNGQWGCETDEDGSADASRTAVALGWEPGSAGGDEGGAGGAGPRLSRGSVHEWIAAPLPADAEDSASSSAERRLQGSSEGGVRGDDCWMPPAAVLIHAARRSFEAMAPEGRTLVAWIGRRCWPFPRALAATPGVEPTASIPGGVRADTSLLDASVFVDAADENERLWAIESALRCPSVAAVVADGSRLSLAGSRRLQLAAAAHGPEGPIALLARPPSDRALPSAARTRWLVTPRPAASSTSADAPAALPGRAHADQQAQPPPAAVEPGWTVRLLRRKGVRPASEDARSQWIVRRRHDDGSITSARGLDAHAPDRSAPPTPASAAHADAGISKPRLAIA
jgi:hypothetical protein